MTLREVRQLLVELDLRPSKALGQNFLTDQNIRDLIVRQADLRTGEVVLEIGPGLGALTEQLLRYAGQVIAIEKDRRLCQYLRGRYAGLQLVEADALAVAMPAVDKVVANLPYSISTPILEQLVEKELRPRRMVLTLQREVGQRLAARPRSKDYGVLTLFTQLHYHVTLAHVVSSRCFYPSPRVESAIVVLDRREPRVKLLPDAPFHEIVRLGFSQRRKMLRKLVRDVEEVLGSLGVPSTARAEELSLEQWIAVANALVRPG